MRQSPTKPGWWGEGSVRRIITSGGIDDQLAQSTNVRLQVINAEIQVRVHVVDASVGRPRFHSRRRAGSTSDSRNRDPAYSSIIRESGHSTRLTPIPWVASHGSA